MLLLPQTLEEEGDNNKERTTATTKKVPVQKQQNNGTCENCDSDAEGVATERGRDCTYCFA
jgi:hypothetical protein